VAKLFARIDTADDAGNGDRGRRTEEILLIQATMRRKIARRRARFVAGSVAAVALVAAAALAPRFFPAPEKKDVASQMSPLQVVASSSAGATVVPPAGAPIALAADAVLASGSRLHVGPEAGAHLALSTGTRIAMDPGSDVTVRSGGHAAIIDLTGGSLKADVAKLAPDERFVVETADTEVEVRGTSFRVSVVPLDASCGDGTTTRVAVYEGVVAVRRNGREETVTKGEEWPKGCVSAPAATLTPDRTPAAKSAETSRGARQPASVPEVSLLARENDDFAEAMLARRSTDTGRAIAAFDHFLARHPASHLAEDAYAERMELLSTVDRVKAAAAARQYLTKYPGGFARRTAADILARSREPLAP